MNDVGPNRSDSPSLARQYWSALVERKKLLGTVFLWSFFLWISTPFVIIMLKSVGRNWFGKKWLPPNLTLDWYKWAVTVANIPKVLGNTLIIAAIAVALSTLIALPTGWALGRRKVPAKELFTSIILLPRMIPPIAYALGVAQIFYRLHLVDKHLGVGIAHVAVCAPYAILVLSSTFQALDDRVLEAAAVCGAGKLRTFFHVILPMVLPGILSSIIFTFTTSYNELTLTLMTYGPHTITLPVRTYLAVGEGYWEVTSAMSMILVIPSFFVLYLIQREIAPEKLVGGFKGV
ncbi:MAG TPA: ABC transporter permease [Anaerolineae bacterium]|nr:ABC transporter permease [Anaerolineae bacterium]HNT06195.1 ABC transporter permease [Anaerolineae bacterium]